MRIHEHKGIPKVQVLKRRQDQREGEPQRRQSKLDVKDEEEKGRDTVPQNKAGSYRGMDFFPSERNPKNSLLCPNK